jgi:hypothetical protein
MSKKRVLTLYHKGIILKKLIPLLLILVAHNIFAQESVSDTANTEYSLFTINEEEYMMVLPDLRCSKVQKKTFDFVNEILTYIFKSDAMLKYIADLSDSVCIPDNSNYYKTIEKSKIIEKYFVTAYEDGEPVKKTVYISAFPYGEIEYWADTKKDFRSILIERDIPNTFGIKPGMSMSDIESILGKGFSEYTSLYYNEFILKIHDRLQIDFVLVDNKIAYYIVKKMY